MGKVNDFELSRRFMYSRCVAKTLFHELDRATRVSNEYTKSASLVHEHCAAYITSRKYHGYRRISRHKETQVDLHDVAA